MVFMTCENSNTDTGDEHTVSYYITVNGDTSNTTDNTLLRAKNGLSPTFAPLSIVHRTSLLQPATYTISVYAKADANSVMNMTHLDIGAIGHLTSV